MIEILHIFNHTAPQNYSLKTASLRDRIIAQLIDGVFLGIVAAFFYYWLSGGKLLSIWVSPMLPQYLLEVKPGYSAPSHSVWWGGLFVPLTLFYGKTIHVGYPSPLLWLIYAVYYTGFTARFGQTPGKMIKRLVIIPNDGDRLPAGIAFRRWLSYIVSFLPLGMGFWMMSLRPDGQTWHDRWCDTRVYTFEKK